jgi:hypothetical protein
LTAQIEARAASVLQELSSFQLSKESLRRAENFLEVAFNVTCFITDDQAGQLKLIRPGFVVKFWVMKLSRLQLQPDPEPSTGYDFDECPVLQF